MVQTGLSQVSYPKNKVSVRMFFLKGNLLKEVEDEKNSDVNRSQYIGFFQCAISSPFSK